MNQKIIFYSFLFASIGLVIASCTDNSQEEILAQLDPCDTSSVTYATDIKPILDQFCNTAGCHNSVSMANSMNLETFSTLQPIALGPRFIGSINHSVGFNPMPKGSGKLDKCKIEKIRSWVNQGAPNN